jgi:hypothetical protein
MINVFLSLITTACKLVGQWRSHPIQNKMSNIYEHVNEGSVAELDLFRCCPKKPNGMLKH